MIFTDLAELLVKHWGNFMRTEIFNSLKTKQKEINELFTTNNKLSCKKNLLAHIAIIITEH